MKPTIMEEQILAIKQESTYNQKDSVCEAIPQCKGFQPKCQKVSPGIALSVLHSKQKIKDYNEKVLQNLICKKIYLKV